MFLNLLKQDEQKRLFMQLASVMALSDGVVAYASEQSETILDHTVVASSLFSLSGLFSSKPSNSEILEQMTTRYNADIWKSLKCQIGEPETYMLELFAAEMGLLSNSLSSLSDWQERYFIRDFEKYLTDAFTHIYQDPDAKKKIMLSLAESDVDLAAIDQKAIESESLKISELRSVIFSCISNEFIKNSGLVLTSSEKKSIIFELIGIAYSDNELSEVELMIVKSIAACFEIDEETLHEITELVVELNRVSSEALDLIKE
ncbi:hypothetical protein VXK10_002908 [Vibrio parahaemolyticus]|nr:hypothetical protein [Vibrio parahaemolyticus]